MAGSRIPLISTPITLPYDQDGKHLPALGIEPTWFRFLQEVLTVIASLPPPASPPPPPAQANILFQQVGVALGTANPPFVSFNFAANASRVGDTVNVDYSHVPGFDIVGPADQTWVGRCGRMTADVTMPAGVFFADDIFTLYDKTNGALNIVQGAGTLVRLGGTTTTGTRIIAPRGLVTVWCPANDEFVMVGNVT